MSPRTLPINSSLDRRKVTRNRRSFVPTAVGLAALEVRQVQSTAVLAQGILTVTGTTGNDTIKVIESTSSITADGKPFAVGLVNSIVVNGLDGKDTITVTSKKPATLNGGPGDDTLTATSGKDTLIGGDGTNSYAGSYYTDMITDPILTGGRAMEKQFMDLYQYDGGMTGFLGAPVGDEHQAGWVSWVDFKNGTLITSPGGGTFEIHGAIRDKYVAMGGGTSFLGLPIANQVTSTVGSACEFQGGTLVSPVSGGQAFEVHGAIRDKYYALGGGNGSLGLPTSDEQTSGALKVNHFQNGSIYWSGQPGDTVGAHVLYGAIRDRYVALGGGNSFLGLPTGDQMSTWAGNACEFQNGTLVSAVSGGQAFEVHGPIRNSYYALGGGMGLLGLPTSDVFLGPDGWLRSKFEGGELVWQASAGVHLFENRNEVKTALRRSQGDFVLDINEYNFFTTIANDQNVFVDSITRFLTGKLVGNDPSNASVNGFVVGNLAPNSPATRVFQLEQKWFEGADHPVDSYTRTNADGTTSNIVGGTYQTVNGPLFGAGGPVYTDVRQGAVGDCFFLASLAEMAYRNPQAIRSMFTDNGDGTYAVRFVNGTSQYVTVDRMLPSGGATFAAASGTQPIWVALAEKAYAQMNQSGWLSTTVPKKNTYAALESGYSTVALTAITGISSSSIAPNLTNAWIAGASIVLNTKSPSNTSLVPSHSYAVVGYNSTTQEYTLFNPWGVNGNYLNGIFRPGFIYETQTLISINFANANRTNSAASSDRAIPGLTRLTGAADQSRVTLVPLVIPENSAEPRLDSTDTIVSLRTMGGQPRPARGLWASRNWTTGPKV